MKKKRQAPKGGGSGRRGGRRSSGGGAVSMEVDALHGTADVSDGGRLALDDLRQWSIRGDHQHGEANGGSPARNRRRGKAHQRAQGLPAHAQPRRRSRRGSCGKDDTSARAKRRGGKTRAPSEKHAVDPLWGLLSTGSSGGSDGSDVQDYVQNTQDNMLDMETLAAAVEQAHLSALPTADVKTSSSDDETDSGAESNTEFVEFDDLFPRIDPLNFNGPAELAAVSTSLSAALNKLRQLVPDLTSSAESPRQRQKAFALAAEIQSIGHRLDDTVREMARASHAAPGQGDGAGLLHGSGAPSAAAAAAAALLADARGNGGTGRGAASDGGLVAVGGGGDGGVEGDTELLYPWATGQVVVSALGNPGRPGNFRDRLMRCRGSESRKSSAQSRKRRTSSSTASCAGSPTDFETVNSLIRQFVLGSKQTFRLDPMKAKDRKRVHDLAALYRLHTESQGSGGHRRPVLRRTIETGLPDKGLLETCRLAWRSSQLGYMPTHAQPTMCGRGVVGGLAQPIGTDNVGNRLLQQMGWSPGMGLGAAQDGIVEPVEAVFRPRRQGFGVE
eukprot:m.230036 g.230036  ORF g.230036 m.230036 type:complete len:558 (-) comp18856_c4_seq4:45-1718(-)